MTVYLVKAWQPSCNRTEYHEHETLESALALATGLIGQWYKGDRMYEVSVYEATGLDTEERQEEVYQPPTTVTRVVLKGGTS